MSKILLIIGTRPELIKVAPLAHEFIKRGLREEFAIVNTAQHKDLLEPYWDIFDIKPDFTLDVMKPGQSLSSLTARALVQIQEFLDNLSQKPQLILAQGDTTTVMASSMVAFFNKIKFAHLEAGLRSFDFENPFPEEFNRRVAAIHADIHLAPTQKAKENLCRENYPENKINIVGNSVIDALNYIVSSPKFKSASFSNETLKNIPEGRKLVLITCHRRENQGENLLNIISAVSELADENKEMTFIWAIHPNPNVKNVVINSALSEQLNVVLTPPLDYLDILKVMNKCHLIISDSGGIQEEAPSFGVPVIVLREKTERPEGVEMGIATLVGAEKQKIKNAFKESGNIHFNEQNRNPYGDGHTASRCVDNLLEAVN